jgi:hypothetical protein
MPQEAMIRFQIEHKNCRVHGTAHLHVKVCPRCMAVLDGGECSGKGCAQPIGTGLGTWGDPERWRCVEGLA